VNQTPQIQHHMDSLEILVVEPIALAICCY
jgi:hypothetical protein